MGDDPDVDSEFGVEERNQGSAWILAVNGELDLRQIEFMDSTGLRVLLGAHQRAQERGRRFALVRGADQVERVLKLTGVRDLLTVVDAPEDLLAAGESPSEAQ